MISVAGIVHMNGLRTRAQRLRSASKIKGIGTTISINSGAYHFGWHRRAKVACAPGVLDTLEQGATTWAEASRMPLSEEESLWQALNTSF